VGSADRQKKLIASEREHPLLNPDRLVFIDVRIGPGSAMNAISRMSPP
jgi:hypothetical protein